ncbi:biotin-independent malonate decarboxylase subunit gamma [Bordetella bronchialis]|uniref:biotin-independent malonate decarboxylase subunit gamma n=1 Tax=Bordetella bronchialis TaxID=463025 RepID=UPI003D02D257
MSHDELLQALFPTTAAMAPDAAGILDGMARLADGRDVTVIGVTGARPVGTDLAIDLSGRILRHVATHAGRPLVLLVDAGSQLMARRDELLGLNEYLAHLAKSLYLASATGSRTVGILYGAASAGAMIATAMAVDHLVVVPGADPSVMNLRAMSRVTKLPVAQLRAMAERTPVFAPGVAPMMEMGGIAQQWDEPAEYAARLLALLSGKAGDADDRDALGASRGGRLKAAAIAAKVQDEAAHHA